MPTFHYKALTADGKKRKGFIEAENKARAFGMLLDKDLIPVSLGQSQAQGGESRRGSLRGLRDLLPFGGIRLGESCYYLALMLQSGTSLAEALELLGRMAGGRAGRVWMDLRDTVEGGVPFSKALERHPRHFSKIYVGMVSVSESVGKLGPVLERIAEYEERRAEVGSKLATAMVYPSLILMVGAGAVYFLLANVMPTIAGIFSGAKAEMPANTRMLLSLGIVLKELGPMAFVPPLAAVLAFIATYRRSERFKRAVDKRLWAVPLQQKNLLGRFSGMLGFQLDAGIPLVRALEHSAEALGNSHLQKLIRDAAREVSAGRPLDAVLAETGQFPDIYVLTISTGQRSGKLASFLLRLAHIFEREVDNAAKRILAYIEPALILVIGVVVAFIILSVMGPIFEMTSLIR